MKYSYIKARKKSPISSELQLLFSFFSITILMLLLTYLFLIFKDYRFSQESKEILLKIEQLNKDSNKMKEQITFIEKEIALNEKITTTNTVLKDSIANLFDLVPQRITLSQATLLENGLILYGITPNKDLYNFMLQAPLRSIFQKTYSSFYPAENGWLNFVSTNYVDEDEFDTKVVEIDDED
ncbi:MAG: hypothetical protein U9N33_11890 [Campylobacterota bacterium]|nr:hypothetical protein [Campylobacterota bacterium]